MEVSKKGLSDFFNINIDNERSLIKVNFALYMAFTFLFVDLISAFNGSFFSEHPLYIFFLVLFNMTIPILAIWARHILKKFPQSYFNCFSFQSVTELMTGFIFVYLAILTFYKEKIEFSVLHLLIILVCTSLIIILVFYRCRILKYGKKNNTVKPVFYACMIPIALIAGYSVKHYIDTFKVDTQNIVISVVLVLMAFVYFLIFVIYFQNFLVAKKCNAIDLFPMK